MLDCKLSAEAFFPRVFDEEKRELDEFLPFDWNKRK
jgi:hypothetical protein